MLRILLLGILATLSLANPDSVSESKVVTRLADVLVSDLEIGRQQNKLSKELVKRMQENNQMLRERLGLFIENVDQKMEFFGRFDKISQEMSDTFQKRIAEDLGLGEFLRQTTMEIYASEFTDREMVYLGRFFTSPIGRKYLEKNSLILEELVRETHEFIVPRLMVIQSQVQEDYSQKMQTLHKEYVEY